MPIYEYKCAECEFQFEKIQKFSDPPLEICPECEGRVSKLLSLSSFHLKGSGWYKTDYAPSTPKKTDSEPAPKPEKTNADSK